MHIEQSFFMEILNLRELNQTLIVPMPKSPTAQLVSEFRHFSICNVIYKIISKLLASRLKLILQKCISEEHSAFIQNKQIVDNIILASECFKKINGKVGKSKWCALKIDMATAFDRIEWGYLLEVLNCHGFSPLWCSLIYKCISTSISVLLNGTHGHLKPS